MAHIIDNKTGKANYFPVLDGELSKKLPENKSVIPEKTKVTANIPTGNNNFSSDSIRTRDALTSFGLDNEKIGYDGKNVTYEGKAILTPTQNENGVTKTDAKSLMRGVDSAFKNQGSDDYVVDVTEYAATNTRLPNVVKYNENGSVTLGGVPINNVVIIDGNSFAPKSAIEAAVSKFKQHSGYTTQTEAAKNYLNSTQKQADAYVDKINNYAHFTYDPESDPAYQAYKTAFLRNAEAAQKNTLAENNARTGGYSNSAAIAAGNQAYYNHLNSLNDLIPSLMDNAYKRYIGDYDMLINGIKMYGTPQDRQKLLSDANAADTEALYKALAADYQRDSDNREYNYKLFKDGRDFKYQEAQDAWYRENIYTPESMLRFQDYEYNNQVNPYLVAQEKAKAQGYELDNKSVAKKYGFKY